MRLFPGRTSRRSSLRSDLRDGWLYDSWASTCHLLRIDFFGARCSGAFAFGHQSDRGINRAAAGQFGAAPDSSIAELGIKLFQGKAADNLVPKNAAVDGERIFAGLDHEFIEARRSREQNFGMFSKLSGSVCGLGQILSGQFLQSN